MVAARPGHLAGHRPGHRRLHPDRMVLAVTHLVSNFTYRPVTNTAGDPIRPIGLILHVQAGNNSPYGWFNNPASEASSTLWAGKDGQREQYVPMDVRAWAQGAG